MTGEQSQQELVQRIDTAAATLRAIADCLVQQGQPPAAFGQALGALSGELAELSRDVSRSSPAATGDAPRMNGRRPAPTAGP